MSESQHRVETQKAPENKSSVQMQSEIDLYMQQGKQLMHRGGNNPLEEPSSTLREDQMLARMPIVADRYMRYFPTSECLVRQGLPQPEEKQNASLWRSRVKPLAEVAPKMIE
jgi:hypothetical protein